MHFENLNRLFHFLSIQGVWKGNSLGVCQKHFPRESRGSGQAFQRGHTSQDKPSSRVTPRKLVSYGQLSATPHGIPGPKLNLENCLPYPCMAKNGIAQW